MDRGKRKVEEPALNEVERRQLRARRNYAIAAEQFWPLVGQVDRWLGQHKAPHQGQEEQNVSNVEDSASPAPADQGLLDTLNNILKRLERSGEASGSSQVADPMPELSPTNPTPEVPPADAEPKVPPTNLKPEAPLAESKPKASSP